MRKIHIHIFKYLKDTCNEERLSLALYGHKMVELDPSSRNTKKQIPHQHKETYLIQVLHNQPGLSLEHWGSLHWLCSNLGSKYLLGRCCCFGISYIENWMKWPLKFLALKIPLFQGWLFMNRCLWPWGCGAEFCPPLD